jgi:hypothetical protein
MQVSSLLKDSEIKELQQNFYEYFETGKWFYNAEKKITKKYIEE